MGLERRGPPRRTSSSNKGDEAEGAIVVGGEGAARDLRSPSLRDHSSSHRASGPWQLSELRKFFSRRRHSLCLAGSVQS